MGKYRNIKKLLRSNEMGEMLLKSINTEEMKKLIWLLGDDSEDMDEQARLLRAEEIKNSVKCHAYADAAKAQSQNLNSAKNSADRRLGKEAESAKGCHGMSRFLNDIRFRV